MNPPWVIVMISPSLASRSSMLISPASGTIWVRRGVAYLALIVCTSSLMIASTRDSRARMSMRSRIVTISSVYSPVILSRSRPVSW